MTRRIERAMALLRRGDLSVTEVCFTVGCGSLGSFSSRFTELVGVPPSVYQRRAARATVGLPSWVAEQMTRPVRNQEAPTPEPQPASLPSTAFYRETLGFQVRSKQVDEPDPSENDKEQ
jgi:hypothetical protein